MKILCRLDRTVVDGHESSRNKPYRFQPSPALLPEVFPNDRHAALPHCYRRILKLFCSDLRAENAGSGRPCRFYGRTAAELRSALAGASPGLGRGKPRPHTSRSDIQVLHIERIVFDEFAAGFDIFAHQGGEDGFALGDVFKPYGE